MKVGSESNMITVTNDGGFGFNELSQKWLEGNTTVGREWED
jgi:hypothetical protein